MTITPTEFEGLFIIQPLVFNDARGYFMETYNESVHLNNNLNYKYIQDNESLSQYGVIRGLHYQRNPDTQVKLVRVTSGKVIDVVLDLRPDQKTFGKHFSIILSSENKTQLLVPVGFAHGYGVLSDTAIFNYKCTAFYNKSAEGGVNLNDEHLQIDWRIPKSEQLISSKDLNWPNFGDHLPL